MNYLWSLKILVQYSGLVLLWLLLSVSENLSLWLRCWCLLHIYPLLQFLITIYGFLKVVPVKPRQCTGTLHLLRQAMSWFSRMLKHPLCSVNQRQLCFLSKLQFLVLAADGHSWKYWRFSQNESGLTLCRRGELVLPTLCPHAHKLLIFSWYCWYGITHLNARAHSSCFSHSKGFIVALL